MTISRDILRQKLGESIQAPIASLTRRDVRLPRVAGKALAVIGVRRGGKTSFLHQCRAERVASGKPLESQLLLTLEDERLVGMTVRDLGWLLEEYARQHPSPGSPRRTFYLDEVQTVPGWEGLVRRLMDAGAVEIFVSGSSAKLLSREVATSLRGRALEVLVLPFSFREVLRHEGREPTAPWDRMAADEQGQIVQRLRRYLREGGFPETLGAEPRDRMALLTSYVDLVVLRDIIDRHGVTNTIALRWLQRQLLANPGGTFSIKKHFDTARSIGIAIGKDTMHEFLGHLEDTFLVRTVAMASRSERQRMVNPRKAYPVDPGLIALYDATGTGQPGHALETAILLELERRGFQVDYLTTAEGFGVDFVARRAGESPVLIQVSLETDEEPTWTREVRALVAATKAAPRARGLLLTLDSSPPHRELPERITWMSAAQWLLEPK